jgi:hypothetical protein
MDLFPIAYAAPVSYFAMLMQSEQYMFEVHEYLPKQTIRNHCNILTSHGIMKLSIPLENRKNKTLTKDIKISYTENWQKHHWRSIVTTYNNSAFFEFYADRLEKIYQTQTEFLVDFNQALFIEINRILKTNFSYNISQEYIKTCSGIDHRATDFAKQNHNPYYQLFSEKEFVNGLSIFDLIFNEGNRSKEYLQVI